jgi:SAM-dependent methyltransferase
LYAHPPGIAFERERQAQYASWIAASVPRPPASILDVGCGNGSLLLSLRGLWPDAALLGCDPSRDSVAHGLAAGLSLWRGTASDLQPQVAELVTAVNVIEHTVDPVAFMADLVRAAKPGGHVIVICPNGERPDVELLFADHFFSFTAGHLHQIAGRAGLTSRATSTAAESLGNFHMIVGSTSTGQENPDTCAAGVAVADLTARRRAFLDRWGALDAQLRSRLASDVICFGTGEAATLLRAYAPQSWALVKAYTADVVTTEMQNGLPVIPLDRLPTDARILAGVRSADQPRVADRLRKRFSSVTTWYDLVE